MGEEELPPGHVSYLELHGLSDNVLYDALQALTSSCPGHVPHLEE